MKNTTIVKEFKNPSSLYRGKPFWAWNGPLDEKELRRQLRIMKKMGLGGAFMHSRTGLETEYLSEEWFKLINACADECRKLKMEAWLYDEDRWPSGAAGGLATKKEKFRAKKIHVQIHKSSEYNFNPKHQIIFAAELHNDTIFSYRKVSRKDLDKISENCVISCEIRNDEPSSWYNWQTYLDTMSEDAVRHFIKITHEAYRKNSKDFWGKEIPGIFTDEPNYGTIRAKENRVTLPWTPKLFSVFKKKYGYDITEKIPEIIFKNKDDYFSKVRHDYYETITNLFVKNFAKQIYDFCEKYKILFTGHVLCEESLVSQTHVVGSAMRFYEYMQAPGIDILCAQGLEREGSPKEPEFLTAKQCSSVLNQMGRKWMLSELYGCTGWHFSLAEHKAVGDWQALLGVNLRCHHLSWYTMKGEAKRDYPASISFQSPYWKDYPVVEDYFARLGSELSQGKSCAEIGIIHPIESAWAVAYQKASEKDGWAYAHQKENNPEPLAQLDKDLKEIQNILLKNHYDFDYIDEDILSRHGKNGKGILKVGKSAYSTIIVPPLFTLRKSTVKFLANFAKSGGRLLFISTPPQRIDCEINEEISNLIHCSRKIDLSENSIIQTLSEFSKLRKISVKDLNGQEFKRCLATVKETNKGEIIVFICATFQADEAYKILVEVKAKGQVQEWDCQTGELFLADYEDDASFVKIKSSLCGCGSRLFIITPYRDNSIQKREIFTASSAVKLESEYYPILRDEPNVFPLDMPELSINNQPFQKKNEILKIDSLIRESAGWEKRSGHMCQPWADKDKDDKKIPVKLRYKFVVETMPKSPCFIAIECPENFKFKLNQTELFYDEISGTWVDNSFKKIYIPPQILKTGENILELYTEYTKQDSLEAIYFGGEFGFKWQKDEEGKNTVPTIIALPEQLKLGDWGIYGFPTYTGSITYLSELYVTGQKKSTIIKLKQWKGSMAKIYVNGQLAGQIYHPPYEADITKLVCEGKNEIRIEIVADRRNIFGPLHNKTLYPIWTGPYEFKDYGNNWTDEYVRLPYGLMDAPEILFGEYK